MNTVSYFLCVCGIGLKYPLLVCIPESLYCGLWRFCLNWMTSVEENTKYFYSWSRFHELLALGDHADLWGRYWCKQSVYNLCICVRHTHKHTHSPTHTQAHSLSHTHTHTHTHTPTHSFIDPLTLCSPLLGLSPFCSFLVLYTISRTPWTGDQPVARLLPTQNNTNKE
jgi:hypothetical protein